MQKPNSPINAINYHQEDRCEYGDNDYGNKCNFDKKNWAINLMPTTSRFCKQKHKFTYRLTMQQSIQVLLVLYFIIVYKRNSSITQFWYLLEAAASSTRYVLRSLSTVTQSLSFHSLTGPRASLVLCYKMERFKEKSILKIPKTTLIK